MKRVYLCFIALSLFCGVSAYGVLVDSIVATVDTEVILMSDLMREVGDQLSTPGMDADAQQQLLHEALKQAVEQRILIREALLSGIEIDEDYVEDQLRKLRALYPSNEAFQAELEQAGETLSDFRDRLRKDRMAQVMGYRKMDEFEAEVVVSASEVAQYYEDNLETFRRPERARARQIFLAAVTDSERAQARARLERLQEELNLGAEFGELAKAHSEAPGAEEGGIIGWVQRGDLVAPLEEAVFALEAGQVSGIVETDGGVSLLLTEAHEPAGLATLEEVRSEIEPVLRRKGALERYDKWQAELRKVRQVHIFL
jgi:parvulin-like peptidyl-prolyl isomerase